MAGLVRKKVTVRGKRKTYQRTVMVRANAAKPTHMPRQAPRKLKSAGGQMGFGQFMKQHGKHYLAGAAGIGALQGAAGYTGARIATKRGGSALHGYAAGSLGTGLAAGVAAGRSRRGKQIAAAYERMGALGQTGAYALGLGAHMVGQVAGAGAAHGIFRGARKIHRLT